MTKEKKIVHPISISPEISRRTTAFKDDQGRNFSNAVEFILTQFFKELDKKK